MNKAAVGITGVHYVCAALSEKGYAVAPTSRNTQAIDILASVEDGSKQVSIQVKTSGVDQPDKYWQLNEKDEKRASICSFEKWK